MIASAVLIILLTMAAETTRNMYSNLAEKNKYDCLKLHHVGYLIKYTKGYTMKLYNHRNRVITLLANEYKFVYTLMS
jgi:hypothetical protein